MSEKYEQVKVNPDELSRRDRIWYDLGKEFGDAIAEQLALRDKRLAALERVVKRLERRSLRTGRHGGQS